VYITLIESFRDTYTRFQSDPQLARKTEQMKANSRLYQDGVVSTQRTIKGEVRCEVVENTTFRCAQGLLGAGKRVAVLNFANPHEPGGGVRRGAMAQEECLCRSSNLFFALDQNTFAREYYKWHRNHCGDTFSDRLIYSPGVMVIKSDDEIPVLLDKPFEVDVITCAAPYLRFGQALGHEQELSQIYRSRIRNILETAMSCGVDRLVLGAFGCGAFHNDPARMADAFYDLLIREGYAARFERVVFAIKADGRGRANYEAFARTFAGAVAGKTPQI